MKMIIFLLMSWTLTSFADERRIPDPYEKSYTVGTYRGEDARQQCYQTKNSFEQKIADIQDKQFFLIESSCSPVGAEAYRLTIKYFSDFSWEFKRESINLTGEYSCASQAQTARDEFTKVGWTVFETKCDSEKLKANFLLYSNFSHKLDTVELGPYHESKSNCLAYRANSDFGKDDAPLSLGKYCRSVQMGMDGEIFYRQTEQLLKALGKNINRLSGESFKDLSSCLHNAPSSQPFIDEGLGVFDITCERKGSEKFTTIVILNDELLTKVVDYQGLSYETLAQCRTALDSLEKSLTIQRRRLLYGYCQSYETEIKLMAFTTRRIYDRNESF